MLQSRRWIESESEAVAGGEVTFGDGIARPESCAQVTLSPQQLDVLTQCAATAGLDREVVLSRLISAALAGPENFDRFDRHRLRRCIDLLRAIEVHVARVARSMTLRQLPPDVTARRADELVELGRYLRRVGSGLLPLRRDPASAEEEPAELRAPYELRVREAPSSDS